MDAQQLGQHVSGHAIDNARRRRTSSVILGVGVAALVVGVPLLIADINRPRGTPSQEASGGIIEQVLGGLMGLGLLGLVAGAILLAKALRAKPERYDVFERGIVHRLDTAVSVITWTDIASVRVQGTVSDAFLARALGTDFSCTLRLSDGRRLRFTSIRDRSVNPRRSDRHRRQPRNSPERSRARTRSPGLTSTPPCVWHPPP